MPLGSLYSQNETAPLSEALRVPDRLFLVRGYFLLGSGGQETARGGGAPLVKLRTFFSIDETAGKYACF